LVCSFAACQENFVHRYCAVDSQDWQKQYKGKLHIEDIKEKGTYQLKAEVRIDKQYLYKDLWLEIETHIRTEKSLNDTCYKDTVCIDIIKQNGEMSGTGRNIMEYKTPVREMSLAPSDTLDICMRHILTTKPVPGVHDIGILLIPHHLVSGSINAKQDKKQDGKAPKR